MTYVAAYLAGFGVLVAYFVVCLVVEGTPRIWVLAEGQDGRLSTSKAQWLLWTVSVAFGYVTIYAARAVHGDHNPLSTVPQNVLIALGFSSVTMATAKGVTTYYVAQGRTPKPPATTTSQLSDLVQDDTGASDLSKTQLLTWTLIAVALFLVSVIYRVGDIHFKGPSDANNGVPDINTALLVLSGLAQGGYLGKKLVTANDVQVSSLVPTSIAQADAIIANALTVYGSGFGDVPKPAPQSPPVVAVLPMAPVGPAPPAVSGVPAPPAPVAPTMPVPPVVPAAPVQPSSPPGCAVLANGFQAIIDAWADAQITFHLPAAHPSLAPLNAAPPQQLPQVSVAIAVVVAGQAGVDAGNVIVVR